MGLVVCGSRSEKWDFDDKTQGVMYWKDVISEKKREGKARFADKDLSSWTGLGRSGHVQIPTFGLISHVSGPKLTF